MASLARTLRDSITLNKLPVLEPAVFTGESRFKTLIESKAILETYLKRYIHVHVGEPVLKAVEGFFYDTSEESYKGAWKLLEERYGHPFKVQRAFRDKLSKWQKIGLKDAAALQQFADFLKACKDAIPHVPDL